MKLLFRSLKNKINTFILSAVVISFVVFSLTFIVSEKNRLSEEISNSGKIFATFSSQTIYNNFVSYYTHNTNEDFDNFQKNVEIILLNNKDVINVSLIGVNGRILFDSKEFVDGKYSGETRAIEDVTTLKMIKEDSIVSREIEYNGENVTEIISPLNQDGSHIFSIKYILSHESLSDRMREVYYQILLVVIPLLILISFFTFLFVRQITKPLHLLIKAIIKIREGDLDSKIENKTIDEIGQLGSVFNDMTTKLKESYTILDTKIKERTKELEEERGSLEKKVFERTAELEELKKGLEKTVEERTEKLNIKLVELGKMNKIMVDRELKMIELKKEIEELKRTLGSNN
jgi:methyl-accepting chemotaxis protein